MQDLQGQSVSLTNSSEMKPVVILEMVTSTIGTLVMKFHVDHVMRVLVRHIDDADHVEGCGHISPYPTHHSRQKDNAPT